MSHELQPIPTFRYDTPPDSTARYAFRRLGLAVPMVAVVFEPEELGEIGARRHQPAFDAVMAKAFGYFTNDEPVVPLNNHTPRNQPATFWRRSPGDHQPTRIQAATAMTSNSPLGVDKVTHVDTHTRGSAGVVYGGHLGLKHTGDSYAALGSQYTAASGEARYEIAPITHAGKTGTGIVHIFVRQAPHPEHVQDVVPTAHSFVSEPGAIRLYMEQSYGLPHDNWPSSRA